MNNKFDGLEKFFYAQFLKAESGENNWNTPPDDVFYSAIQEVNAAKRKRRGAMYIRLTIVLLALLIGGFVVSTQYRLDVLNEKVEELYVQKDERAIRIPGRSPSSDGHLVSKGDGMAVLPLSEGRMAQEVKVHELKQMNAEFRVSSPGSVRPPSRGIQHIPIDHMVAQGKASTSLPLAGVSRSPTIGVLSPLREILALPMKGIQWGLVTPEIPIIRPLATKTKREEIDYWSTSEGILYAGHLLTSLEMQGMSNGDFSLTGYDKYYSGLQIGAAWRVPLENSRWGMRVAPSYSRIQNRSLYAEAMPYNASHERVVLGDTIYSALMEIETPLGTTKREAEFVLHGQGLASGMLIDQKTRIVQSFDILNLHVGVEYSPLARKRYRVSMGVGVTGNYILSTFQSLQTELYYLNDKMMEDEIETRFSESLNKYFYSIRGHASFDLSLNARYGLVLSTGYERSITSLRKVSPPSTYLTHLHTVLGIRRRF